MYIPRTAEKLLKNSLNSPKVLILLGARQVGKTTLVTKCLEGKKAVMLNMDIEVDKNRLMATASLPPRDALLTLGNPDYIVIDEAQRDAKITRIVKGWVDAHVHAKVVLLGSSSLNLLNQSAESLTGRNEKLFLPQLFFREIVANQSWYSKAYSDAHLEKHFAHQLDVLLLQALVFGSYPEAVLSEDKPAFLLNLVSDYLLKDVLQLGLIKTPDLIRRLLLLLAHQAGSEVSIQELSTNLGISRITVQKYIELLEQTFVIFRLPAFSTNRRKEISKNHKMYFWDTGIRNALLKEFSMNPLRSDIGKLWENWVVAEFAKDNLMSGQRRNLFFWRSHAKSEVDLVITEGERISAYEIKWKAERIHKRAFEEKYKTRVRLIDRSHPLFSFEKN